MLYHNHLLNHQTYRWFMALALNVLTTRPLKISPEAASMFCHILRPSWALLRPTRRTAQRRSAVSCAESKALVTPKMTNGSGPQGRFFRTQQVAWTLDGQRQTERYDIYIYVCMYECMYIYIYLYLYNYIYIYMIMYTSFSINRGSITVSIYLSSLCYLPIPPLSVAEFT